MKIAQTMKIVNIFNLPSFIEKMIKNKWLGDKTKQGFYKKTRDKMEKENFIP